MKHLTRTALCAVLALTGLQAHALYRCGSVYQDRPCDSSVEQKQLMKSGAVIVTPATPAPKPAAPAAPAAAAAPVKAAPAPAPAAAPSTAPAPAAAVAPAAPAAPAKPAVVAAPPVAAATPTAPKQAAPAAPPAPAPSAAPAPAPAAAAAAAAVAAARSLPSGNSKARCALLGTQLDSVESKARAGGTAADMERFAQERRAVQKSLVNAGC